MTSSAKVSALDKLRADSSYLEELKRKSEKERIRRKGAAKKQKYVNPRTSVTFLPCSEARRRPPLSPKAVSLTCLPHPRVHERDEANQKRLQKEKEAKLEQERLRERQRRQAKVSTDLLYSSRPLLPVPRALTPRPRSRSLAKVSVEITMSLKKVIDHLTELKETVAFDAIYKKLGCKGSKAKLLELLKKSTFVEVQEEAKPILVKYKSKYDVKNETELLNFMHGLWSKPVNTDAEHGALAEDVVESYRGCAKDVERLVSQGKFYQIANMKTQQVRLFYPDSTTSEAPLDPQLLSLWNEKKVSADELDGKLRDAGIAPATRVFKWRALLSKKLAVKKVEKKRRMNYRNVTNIHMPELFQQAQPAALN